MPHHIHALIKTPEPNLSNGMQHWLSGFANWYAKRNRRKGHLYQGRFKAFQVEDLSYFCTLSRYIHVNPCVGQKPLGENLKLGFIAVTVITLTGDERKIGLRVNCCSTVGKRNTVADIPSPPIAGMSSKNLTSQPQSRLEIPLSWLWEIGSLAPKPFCKKSFCWPSQLGVESHFSNAIQDSRPSGSFRKSRISSTFPPTPMSVSVVAAKAERSRHCFAEN